jgi:hypothetical protein
MDGNIMLDIAIGLVMLYLLGALFCTIIQEWIASLFKLRATNLKAAIGYLVDGKAGAPSEAAKAVLNHPLLRIADKSTGALLDRAPSYVAARNFTTSLVQALDLKVTDGKIDPAAIRARLEALPEELADTRTVLLGMLDAAGTDGGRMLAALDGWYDATMDRASGWYKRQSQGILLAIGVVLALASGADTLAVAQRLVQDNALRASLVALAGSAGSGTMESLKADLTKAVMARIDGAPASGLTGSLPFASTDWIEPSDKLWQWQPGAFIAKLLGCLLTGLALALGAPFWFNLLQKLNAIRSSGPKPAPAAA